METQEVKLFFDVDTTREQAQAIIDRYCDVKIDNFYEKREIGCNTVTYAIITVPFKAALKMNDDRLIKRVDVLNSFKATNSGCCDAPQNC